MLHRSCGVVSTCVVNRKKSYMRKIEQEAIFSSGIVNTSASQVVVMGDSVWENTRYSAKIANISHLSLLSIEI